MGSAIMRLKGSNSQKTNIESIQIIKKQGGRLSDSYLESGFILDKKIGVGQPKVMENCKVLVANTAMDTDKIKIWGSRVKVDNMQDLAKIETVEKEKMKEKIDKIKAHGINVFVNRQLIYNYPEQLFAEAGIMAIEHADFDGVERLSLVTGSEIASTFDHPELVTLGKCDKIEEIMIGEDKLIKFSGCAANEACTIVLRGASRHVLDEAERAIHDALCVLSQAATSDTRIIPGGGNAEMCMAIAVQNIVASVPGKQSLAVEAFAKALMTIPAILADNAGYDSADLVANLRAAHTNGEKFAGLNLYEGRVEDMRIMGVTESFKSKLQILTSAAEAAEMIVRVDDIIQCAPRQREGGGMGGMMGM